MKCQNCGYENEEGTNFCLNCGTKLISVPNDTVACPSCGSPNNKGSKFCYKCGFDLTQRVDVVDEVTEVVTEENNTNEELDEDEFIVNGTSEEPSGITCPECGAINDENTKFCRSCGAKLIEVPTEQGIPCPHCGTMNEKGAKFCEKCGQSMTIEPTEFVGDSPNNSNEASEGKSKFNRKMIIIGVVCLVLLLAGGAGFAFYKGIIPNPFNKDNEYTTLMDKADQLYEKGSYDEAISKYQEAIEEDDTKADAYIKLAQIYEEQGNYDSASSTLQDALKNVGDDNDDLNSEVISVYNYYMTKGNQSSGSDAMTYYQKAIDIKDDVLDPYECMVNYYISLVDADTMDYSAVDNVLDEAKNNLSDSDYKYLSMLKENDKTNKEKEAADKAAEEAKAAQQEAEDKLEEAQNNSNNNSSGGATNSYTTGTYKTTEGMNVRSGPSTSASKVGDGLKANTPITVTEIVTDASGNVWGKIADNQYVCIYEKAKDREWCTKQ